MKTCPNCKLINPVSTQYCDCGYNFQSCAVEENHAAPNNCKKSRFVIGVDAASIFLATPLAKLLGLGGAIPIMVIVVACFYASSFVTNRISRSSLSQRKKVAVYIGLVIGYLVVSVLLFGLAEFIHGQQPR
ncbi:MAG: hypothetical protein Q7T29_12320 [Gallionella sp.]|nr:hypothetical protein [Gallionella sp.]